MQTDLNCCKGRILEEAVTHEMDSGNTDSWNVGGTGDGGYERLFGLDPQLLHDTVFTGAAVFFLFFVLSYFLFNPARDLLQKRRETIAKDLEGAKASREEARRLEEAFEEQMEQADKVAQEKVRETEKRAAKAETVLIREAKKEAESIRLRARKRSDSRSGRQQKTCAGK